MRNVVLGAELPLESRARFPNLTSGHPTSVCTTHSLARHPRRAGHPALADWIGGVPSHRRSGRLVSAGPLLPVPDLTVRGAGWLRYGWIQMVTEKCRFQVWDSVAGGLLVHHRRESAATTQLFVVGPEYLASRPAGSSIPPLVQSW